MNILGYKIYKKNFLDTEFFNRENFLTYFFRKNNQLIIFDVGANKGQSIKYFKRLFTNSIIYSFEPERKNFRYIKNLFKNDKTIIINNFALGEKESIKELYCYKDSAQNSFFYIDKNSEAIKYNAHPKVTKCLEHKIDKQLTNVQTLDNYVEKNNIKNINILKIDTQGFENEVLKGSIKALKNQLIDVIIVEISFDGVYGKENSFYDIEKIIKPNNYTLWDISHIYKDLSRGRTCWVDAVYISKRIKDKL